MSKGVDGSRRARAASPAATAGGHPQGKAHRARPPNDAGSRARGAGAGAARRDLAAAQEEEATVQGGPEEAILVLYLDPGHRDGARTAETDPGLVRAARTHRNQCYQVPQTAKQQAMASKKDFCRQTRNNIITSTSTNSSSRRRRQPRTHLQTSPRGRYHSPAGSTLGIRLSHLLHLLRTIKVNGRRLLLLRRHICLPRQATTGHNNHLRAGSHPNTPRAGLPFRVDPQVRGLAVGRLRLHLIQPKGT